ncbi:hypothetical protein BcepSauron_411 [Burkholderia phage BcepSauron]|uniref:Uncharacterized protein n=1 Tax=Burkholderia phage BcepSauron TaxID=2530033 RepID=A0A482ML60_9CAUD|nr:hypothetical protein H1O17_gp411 [Burkholderia phage BcepSauron]QBQ74791.1 hypothetical protein BcepSauron_411 [Burkholderia phage BcepSauron]
MEHILYYRQQRKVHVNIEVPIYRRDDEDEGDGAIVHRIYQRVDADRTVEVRFTYGMGDYAQYSVSVKPTCLSIEHEGGLEYFWGSGEYASTEREFEEAFDKAMAYIRARG